MKRKVILLIFIGLVGFGFYILNAPHRLSRIQSWISSTQDTSLN